MKGEKKKKMLVHLKAHDVLIMLLPLGLCKGKKKKSERKKKPTSFNSELLYEYKVGYFEFCHKLLHLNI